MPKRELTKEEIKKKRLKKETDIFISSVEDFIRKKNGGDVPSEWSASLMLLKVYYQEFVALSLEIDQLDSYVFNGKYGPAPSPLLGARNSAAIRLESMMEKFGLTMKSAVKMNVAEVKPEESALEKFLKNKTEIETR